MASQDLDDWFVREVLPLEGSLEGFLRRNWPNQSDILDLRQDIYVRVYEAAKESLPKSSKAFVFAVARNLIIDRVRRARIVSMEAVVDLENCDAAVDDLTPERWSSGREELRHLRAALERLPPRCREVVRLRKIEGLSQRDVARRMGITEDTVERQTANGLRAIADYLLSASKGSEIPLSGTKNSKQQFTP